MGIALVGVQVPSTAPKNGNLKNAVFFCLYNKQYTGIIFANIYLRVFCLEQLAESLLIWFWAFFMSKKGKIWACNYSKHNYGKAMNIPY